MGPRPHPADGGGSADYCSARLEPCHVQNNRDAPAGAWLLLRWLTMTEQTARWSRTNFNTALRLSAAGLLAGNLPPAYLRTSPRPLAIYYRPVAACPRQKVPTASTRPSPKCGPRSPMAPTPARLSKEVPNARGARVGADTLITLNPFP